MALDGKKVRQIYDTLLKGGYEQDYATFEKGFSGKENYANRRKVYELLRDNGAGVGDTYEEFMGNLMVSPAPSSEMPGAAQRTKRDEPVERWEPSEKEKAAKLRELERVRGGYDGWSDAMGERNARQMRRYSTEGEDELKRADERARLMGMKPKVHGIGGEAVKEDNQIQNVTERMDGGGLPTNEQRPVVNGVVMRDGKAVTEWLMPDGSVTTDLTDVDRAEARARDARMNHELASRMRRAGLDPDKGDTLQQLEERIEDNRRRLIELYHRRDTDRHTPKPDASWLEKLAASGDFATPYVKKDDSDVLSQIKNLEAEGMMLDEARKMLSAGRDLKKSEGAWNGMFDFPNNAKNLARGAKDKLKDVDLYAGGLAALSKAERLDRISDKLRNGQTLTDAELRLVYAAMLSQKVAGTVELPAAYKAAQTTVEMVPFMAQMALNPASGFSRALVSKFGKSGLKKIALTVAGDVAESAVLANTLQAAGTVADIKDRHRGEFVDDKDGMRFENGQSWATAIAKGEGAAVIENYTELLGAHFGKIGAGLGNGLRKSAEKLGGGKVMEKVSALVNNVKASDWSKAISNIEKRAKWNGTVGEVMEEEAGIVLNALTVGDNSLSDLVDAEQQIDIVLGVGLFGGFVSGLKTAGYPIARARANSRMKKAQGACEGYFGTEKWEGIKNDIDSAEDEGLNDTVAHVIKEMCANNEQAKAVMEYAQSLVNARGYNLASVAAKLEDGNDEAESLDESYSQGYETEDASSMAQVRRGWERARQRMVNELGGLGEEELGLIMSELDADPVGAIERCHDEGLRGMMLEYANAKMAWDGMNRRVSDDIESRVAQSDAEVDARVNRKTGMVQEAELPDGRKVDVVSGVVMLQEDGSVDHGRSDRDVVVRDAATGKLEWKDVRSLRNVGDAMDADELKEAAAGKISGEVVGKAQARMDAWLNGDRVRFADEEGRMVDGEVVDVSMQDAEGSIQVAVADGRTYEVPVEYVESAGAEDETTDENNGEDGRDLDGNSVTSRHGNGFEQNNDTTAPQQGEDTVQPVAADAASGVEGERDRGAIRGYEEGLANQHYDNSEYGERDRREAESERLVTSRYGNGFGQNNDALSAEYNGGSMAGDTTTGVEGDRDRSDIRVYEEGLASRNDAYSEYGERTRRDAETERLVGIAKQNGQFFVRQEILSRGTRYAKNTGESEVVIDDEHQRVYKIKNPYAKSPMKGNVRPEDAIYEHLVHNKYFPETRYQFEGISDETGDLRIVLSQGYVDAVDNATDEQIEGALAEKGLMPEGNYRYGNDEISVTDVTGDNALLGADGKVYFIDPIIDFKKPVREILSESVAETSAAEATERGQNGQQTALSRIPVDENGGHRWEDVDKGVALDGLVEMMDGDATEAEAWLGSEIPLAEKDAAKLAGKVQKVSERDPLKWRELRKKARAAAEAAQKRVEQLKRMQRLAESRRWAERREREKAEEEELARNSFNARIRREAAERERQMAETERQERERAERQEAEARERALEAEREAQAALPESVEKKTAAGGFEEYYDALMDEALSRNVDDATRQRWAREDEAAKGPAQYARIYGKWDLPGSLDEWMYRALSVSGGKEMRVRWGGKNGFAAEVYGRERMKERRDHAWMLGDRGMSFGEFVHRLWEGLMQDDVAFNRNDVTDQDVRNAAVNILLESPKSVNLYDAAKRYQRQREVETGVGAEAEQLRHDYELVRDQWYRDNFHMDEAEYEASVERVYEELRSISEEEAAAIADMLDDAIAEDYETINSNNDERGTDEGVSGGTEVLSGARADEPGRDGADTPRQGGEEASGGGAGAEAGRGEGLTTDKPKLFNYFSGSIRDLIVLARSSANGLYKKIIAPISTRLQHDLAEHGVEISSEYNHIIDNNAIRHALKSHGGKNEEKRGQVPLTDSDFERIDDVVKNYDAISIESGKRNDVNIVYSKSYEDGTTIFVEEKRDGRKELAAVTMWKKKNSTRTDANHRVTPISDLSEVSDDKVNAFSANNQKNKEQSDFVDESTKKQADGVESSETEVEPSEAQKAAGNYRMEHRRIDGYNISIENKKGSVRRGTGADGKRWETVMQNDYGYIRGTEGVDGDHIDVFLSDSPEDGDVFVVDQVNEDGSFDEHKVMYGFPTEEGAREAYLSNYEPGWKGLGAITHVSKEEFKKWVESSRRKTKPFSEYKSVRVYKEQNPQLAIEPDGFGDFGPVFTQFKGDAQGAIKILSELQDGEAIGALHHKEIGDIDLVWGNVGTAKSDGYGLAKLVKYHPEVIEHLQEILDDMHIVNRSENRINLESDTHKAAVRLTWNKEKKQWLLTAFEKKETPKSIDKTTDTGDNPTDLRGGTALSQNSGVSDGKGSSVSAKKQAEGEKSSGKGYEVIEDRGEYSIEVRHTKDGDKCAIRLKKGAKPSEWKNAVQDYGVWSADGRGEMLFDSFDAMVKFLKSHGEDVSGLSDKAKWEEQDRALNDHLFAETGLRQGQVWEGPDGTRVEIGARGFVKGPNGWDFATSITYPDGRIESTITAASRISDFFKANKYAMRAIAGDGMIGRSLTEQEAAGLITRMEANAGVATEMALTIENWDAQFGENGIVSTPIGDVKMGENQFTKLMRQGRNSKLGMIKPTLETPDIIIEDKSEAKDGSSTERESSYVFVKAFIKSDGSRYYYFTSVTVSKDGHEVVVSNQEKRKSVLTNLLIKGKLVWKHADNVSVASDMANGLYSSQGNMSDPATEGTDAPQTNKSSDGKGSSLSAKKQADGEKSLAEERRARYGRAKAMTGKSLFDWAEGEEKASLEKLEPSEDRAAAEQANNVLDGYNASYNEYLERIQELEDQLKEHPEDEEAIREQMENEEALLIEEREQLREELRQYYVRNNTPEDAEKIAGDMIARAQAEVEIRRNRSQQLRDILDAPRGATTTEETAATEKEVKTAGGKMSYNAIGHLPDAKIGEFAYVERQFTRSGEFDFTGSETIRDRGDVAYLFRALEDYSIEHVFAAFVRDGKVKVMHIGMGGPKASYANLGAIRAGYDAFGADKIYLVHNHPSGNLMPSGADEALVRALEGAFESEMEVEGLIVDTTSGRYTSFHGAGKSTQENMPVEGGNKSAEVYRFDRVSRNGDGSEAVSIRSSRDVVSFIEGQRFDNRGKVSYLVLSNNLQVVGNFHTGFSKIDDGKLAEEMVSVATKYGGTQVIVYGNADIRNASKLSENITKLSLGSIGLVDAVESRGGVRLSASDEGLLREEAGEYEAKGRERDAVGAEATADRIEELFKQAVKGNLTGNPVSVGKLTAEGRAYLEKLSGLNLKEDVDFVLNPSDLVHMYRDHFGDNEKDKGNNIPLTIEDIRAIDKIIAYPDRVVFGMEPDGLHRKMFYFLSTAETGAYNLLEIYSDRKGNLTTKTFYKTRKAVSQRVLSLKKSEHLTSVTDGASLSEGTKLPKFFEYPKSENEEGLRFRHPEMRLKDRLRDREVLPESESAKLDAGPRAQAEAYVRKMPCAPVRVIETEADITGLGLPEGLAEEFLNEYRSGNSVAAFCRHDKKIYIFAKKQHAGKLSSTMLHENVHRVVLDLDGGKKEFLESFAESVKGLRAKDGFMGRLYEAVVETYDEAWVPEEYLAAAMQFACGKDENLSLILEALNENDREYLIKNILNNLYGKAGAELKVKRAEVAPNRGRGSEERAGRNRARENAMAGGISGQDGETDGGNAGGRFGGLLRDSVRERIEELAGKLGLESVEVVTDVSGLEGKRAKAKGWFDRSTGKIVVVLPNHASMADAERTLLHESVGHYGLRKLMGEELFDAFLRDVYVNADIEIRRRIAELARNNGWDMYTATEEYLAGLAEEGEFEQMRGHVGFWANVKRLFAELLKKMGFERLAAKGMRMGDNELRYVLWRSYENLKNGGVRDIWAQAEDVVMQYRLKVGNYSPAREDVEGALVNGDLYRMSDGTAREEYDRRVRRKRKKNDSDKSATKGTNRAAQLHEAYLDSMRSLRVLQEAVSHETGEKIEAFENAYWIENAMSSVNKTADEDYQRRYFKPLCDAVAALCTGKKKERKAKYKELTDYIIAKHGLERNSYMRAKWVENVVKEAQKKILSGDTSINLAKVKSRANTEAALKDFAGLTALTNERSVKAAETKASAMVNEYEKRHKKETANLWGKINAATRASLETRFRAGLLSRDMYETIRDQYSFYIPLKGWDDTVAADVYEYAGGQYGLQSALQRAAGRTSVADDPIATIMTDAQRTIMEASRNKMKQAFLNLALNHSTNLLTVSKQWYVKDVDGTWVADNPIIPPGSDAETVDAIVKEHTAKMLKLQKEKKAKCSRKGLTLGLKTKKGEAEEHTVRVRRNGEEYCIYVNGDPRAALAVNGMLNPDANGSLYEDTLKNFIQKVTRGVKDYMSKILTSWNPEFVVTNLSRDLTFAGVAVSAKENSEYAKRYHKNVSGLLVSRRMFSLLWKWEKGTLTQGDDVKPEIKELERYFDEFMRYGGETGYTQLNTVEKAKKEMQRYLRDAQGGAGAATIRGARKLLDGMEYLNRVAEDLTRFAVYMTSRQMGRPVIESVRDAKEITVNFNRKGSGMLGARVLNSLYLFFNASMQALANAGRIVKNHPGKSSVALCSFMAAGFIVPLVARGVNLLINSLCGGDGDDDPYWTLSEWERRNNLVFRIPMTKKFFKLPLPHELRPFYGMGEIFYSIMSGKENVGDGLWKVLEGFTGILPMDMTANGGDMLVNIMPDYVEPIAQISRNVNYFGYPIYKETPWNKDDPEWTKSYKSTNRWITGAAQWISESLATTDEYGVIHYPTHWWSGDINPAMIEHLLESFTGGAGKMINRTGKSLLMPFGYEEWNVREIPILRAFGTSEDEKAVDRKHTNDYFRLSEEHEQLKSYYRDLVKLDKGDAIEKAWRVTDWLSHEEGRKYIVLERYFKRLRKLDKAMDRTDDTEKLDSIKKKIDETRLEMIEKANSLESVAQ